ncbi:hypothetical protein BH11CYA1_BH11CYA1_23610 [soil metagenome]
MKNLKILWGVCGIGMGHTYRQLPLLDTLARDNRIVLFVYGESERFYREHFSGNAKVDIVTVSVPFYVGDANGLDFVATAERMTASGIDHEAINLAALAKAQSLIGQPDLVVSDYEPISARYAYAHNALLVTIDQQSKYLVGDFSRPLAGQTALDEVARLRLFFPKAAARIACSFFNVAKKSAAGEKVLICPPIIKPAIVEMKQRRAATEQTDSVLVYISSQREFVQEIADVLAVLAAVPQYKFHVFVKELPTALATESPANVKLRRHGDPRFLDVLAQCRGIVTTGGHTLVSEAMYLGLPAYLIPLPVYEQQMNAHVVGENGFGICASAITEPLLSDFLAGLSGFAARIKEDKKVLVRGSGEQRILSQLQLLLKKSQC